MECTPNSTHIRPMLIPQVWTCGIYAYMLVDYRISELLGLVLYPPFLLILHGHYATCTSTSFLLFETAFTFVSCGRSPGLCHKRARRLPLSTKPCADCRPRCRSSTQLQRFCSPLPSQTPTNALNVTYVDQSQDISCASAAARRQSFRAPRVT